MSYPVIVRPIHGNCWEVYEADGVQPFFLQKSSALSYANFRRLQSPGELHVFNDQGELEKVETFGSTRPVG